MPNAGDYRWTATIQSPPQDYSATGQQADDWVDEDIRRCKVVEGGGTELTDESQRQTQSTYTVSMRLYQNFGYAWRLTIIGRPYTDRVLYVEDFRHTLTETILTCSERAR